MQCETKVGPLVERYNILKKQGTMENKRKHKRIKNVIVLLLLTMILSLSACNGTDNSEGNNSSNKAETKESEELIDTGFVVAGPESYDSADTALLVDKDEKKSSVTFLNLELGKRYTLTYDGTTRLFDKHGESIAMNQINKGEIVDITFYKVKKHLTTLKLSKEAWSLNAVSRYDINTVRGEVSIGDETYKLTDQTQYLSENRDIEIIDLNTADILSFHGIGNTVYSVRVDKGHGYLRLVNDENFIGGWIEIGQSQIQRITEDMLLVVAEGNYQINISHNSGGGTKNATIYRNEETTLDIGDLEIPKPQVGMVLFSLSPTNAELYIDGSKVDASLPVNLDYGIHQLIAKADNYQSVTQYIRVNQASVGVNVVLDAISQETTDSSDNTSEGSSETTPVTDYYKVYVDAPEKAEVYLDGNYVGISPCSFPKTPGAHVIILRQSGYETRSFTVQIDSENKDISYSFADLVPSSKETTE